jgi:hypothetical protein
METFTRPNLKAATVAAIEMQTHSRGVSGELRIVRGWPAIWAGEEAVLTRQMQLKGQEGSGVRHNILDVTSDSVKVGVAVCGRKFCHFIVKLLWTCMTISRYRGACGMSVLVTRA